MPGYLTLTMARKFIASLMLILNSWQLYSQVVIWQEDFNSYHDGTVTGDNHNEANPAADWFSGECLSCIDTADWWEVRSGRMEARDVNEVVFLQTEQIDIAGFSQVEFSVEVSEAGDHEGLYFGLDACADQEKEDYVNVLYRIDGGPWNLVSNILDWCGLYGSCGSHTLYGDDGINSGDCRDNDSDWGSALVTTSGLSGTSLEIRVETINSATDEIIRLDDMVIKGVAILPVTLSAFSVTPQGNSALLHWQTASEKNNHYFEVERTQSLFENDWETLAVVTGAGHSDIPIDYYYQDQQINPGRSYYRLKQVDFDGRFEYSEIKYVNARHSARLFPNPASNFALVPFSHFTERPEIRIFNAATIEHCVKVKRFDDYIHLDLSNLSSGNYIVTINNDIHRLLVVK